MGNDIPAFWDRVDESLKTSGRRLNEVCASLGISYGTITQNRSQKKYPNLENALSLCKALNASLDTWIYGTEQKGRPTPEAQAVEQSPRLQRIVSILQQSPEKLDAIETILDAKLVPVGAIPLYRSHKNSKMMDSGS